MMDDLPLLLAHIERAKEARDAGLERVSLNNTEWKNRAIQLIRNREWLGSVEFTGEGLRFKLQQELGEISHPNLMGAVVMAAIRHGYIVPLNSWVSMKDPKSHARMTRQYRRA